MSMRFARSAICQLSALFASYAAHGAVLIPIASYPGATNTFVYGINDSNTLVGGYLTPDNNEHGFFGPLNGPYTSFDYPNAPYTEGRGINKAGYITGYAVFSDGTEEEFERYPNGKIKTIEIEGAPLFEGAWAQGINSKGLFVGNYITQDGVGAYYGHKGKYLRELTLPGGTAPRPRGINDSGVVAGYTYVAGLPHGFLLNGDTETLIDYPDARAASTFVFGINKHDIAVGGWENADETMERAFTFDMKSSSYAEIKVPHSKFTGAAAINSAGLIVIQADGQEFVYCPHSAQSGKCPAGGVEIPDSEPILRASAH
jgi:uncharacterized membrane protein